MKKSRLFLIGSLAFITAGVVLAFLYMVTPKTDEASQTSAVTATVEEKCAAKLKQQYQRVFSIMLDTCAAAYRIEARNGNSANFCRNVDGNANVSGPVMASVCGTGVDLAIAARANSNPSPSPSPAPSGQATATLTPGGAQQAQATPNPNAQVEDPPDETTCAGGKGVKLGTKGLDANNCVGSATQNPIFAAITVIAKYLIGLLALVFVFIVVISGFQYIISRGNPDETKAAKQRLEHAVTGIILLVLMTAILNTIIPGGIL